MIPESTAGRNQQSRTGTRGQTERVQTGLPYLNQRNMYDYLEVGIPREVRIIDVRVNPPGGRQSPIVVKLAIKGKSVLWGLTTENPNLEVLIGLFGRSENDWASKNINMSLIEDEFDGRIWPTVSALPEGDNKASKKRGS